MPLLAVNAELSVRLTSVQALLTADIYTGILDLRDAGGTRLKRNWKEQDTIQTRDELTSKGGGALKTKQKHVQY